MKKNYQKLKSILNRQLNSFRNRNFPEPIFLPKGNTGIKIHIGPGDINLQGWINIDARHFSHIHIVSDNINLDQFTDNSISEIYLCHVLEHVSFDDAKKFVSKMYLKLHSNGILRISVPSFDSIIKIYENNSSNLDLVKYALMGGQDYEYNFHKSIYNKSELEMILKSAGFKTVEMWDTVSDFGKPIGDWSATYYESKIGKIGISLNLKAIK